jgi:hypothetical protein
MTQGIYSKTSKQEIGNSSLLIIITRSGMRGNPLLRNEVCPFFRNVEC